jgi:hypothetical protein
VRFRALAGTDVGVGGLPHDGVREFQGRSWREDLHVREDVGRSGDHRIVEPGQIGHLADTDPVAQHRHRPHHRTRGRRRLGQPQAHGLGHSGRTHSPHLVGGNVAIARIVQEFTEVERVAPGGLVAGGSEFRRDAAAEPMTADRRRPLPGQRCGAYDCRVGPSGEPGNVRAGVPEGPR